MDDLDQLLSDLHKNKGGRPQRRSTRTTNAPKSTINFNELDDLMAQFAEVLGETTPQASKTSSTATPSALPSSSPSFSSSSSTSSSSAPKTVTSAPSSKSHIDFDALKFGKLIGKGNFGAVYEGSYNGGKVAIKELYDRGDTNVEKYYQREIEMLSISRHANIVTFLGVAKSKDGKVYVVTEFCEGEGDLHHLCRTVDMSWEKRVNIALGVAKAVAYLHGKGIIHRDLKCENVLLTKDGTPKLCDFGFARPLESGAKKHMTMVGTDWTMAPEILLAMDYTEQVDVFSFGMMLCELISRISPNATNFKRVLPGFGVDPAEVRSKANSGAPAALIDLTIRCTDESPSKRPSCSDIIKVLTTVQDALFDEIGADEAMKLMEAELANLDFSTGFSVPAQETKTVTATSAQVDKDDKDAVTDDLEGVFVRRKLIQMENFDKFVYAVENTRLHDVVLTIEIDGPNAKMLPAGQATGFGYKRVEGVVPTGAQVVFATVEPMHPNERLAFSAQMGVDRIDTEVRFTELQGVFLNTHITHGKITEISFEIYNQKKDNDVEVELMVIGGSMLDGSSSLPIKALVRKGEKKTIGMVRTQDSFGTDWTWRPIVTHPDEVSVVNGVTLKRRHIGGKNFEFEVHNPRSTSITVEINFTGAGASNISPNPALALLRPGATEVVITTALTGQLGMDWKWNEKL